MTTTKQTLPITEPLKFLGSNVISFNASLGYGASAESTLTVDLVDDCENDPDAQPQFLPIAEPENYGVGMPIIFPDNTQQMPACMFGGIIASWTAQKSSSGKTYNVILKDPRQLLENTLIIIDSVIAGPIFHINYYNVYAFWEQNLVYSNNCYNYGLSGSNQKGMPYYYIIQSLINMNINIYPSTYAAYPFHFKVDFSTFPGFRLGTRSLPEWYRVPGPGISILQLLEDICNVLAYDFYVYMEISGGQNIIKIGLIDLNNSPSSFSNILNTFASSSTEISYGQEFRNEKSKMVILGDNVHYLMPAATIDFCFGTEEILDNFGVVQSIPVVPYGYDDCGFWILKKIETLNLSLAQPFPSDGPYSISELDIRAAMSSYEMWQTRAFDMATPGSFNQALRLMHPEGVTNLTAVTDAFKQIGSSLSNTSAVAKGLTDGLSNPALSSKYKNLPEVVNDLKKIHSFLNNLGSTYYGKEFIVKLDRQKICKKYDQETNTYIYTDTPTNNGGWADNTYNIMGLSEPYLSHFRNEDQRIKGFARFELIYNISDINESASVVEQSRNSGALASNFSKASDSIP